jgi:hypothetical protein
MKALGKAMLMLIMIEQQKIVVLFPKENKHKESLKEVNMPSREPSEPSYPSGQVIEEPSIIEQQKVPDSIYRVENNKSKTSFAEYENLFEMMEVS